MPPSNMKNSRMILAVIVVAILLTIPLYLYYNDVYISQKELEKELNDRPVLDVEFNENNITTQPNITTFFNMSLYSVGLRGQERMSASEFSILQNLTAKWDFDDRDGVSCDIIGWNATHIYTIPGSYNVTLECNATVVGVPISDTAVLKVIVE